MLPLDADNHAMLCSAADAEGLRVAMETDIWTTYVMIYKKNKQVCSLDTWGSQRKKLTKYLVSQE